MEDIKPKFFTLLGTESCSSNLWHWSIPCNIYMQKETKVFWR